MSATGEAPLFDGDGTHAHVPQDSFADPLSGLVTSGEVADSSSQDFARLRIADPVEPDPDTVREMVNAAMLADASVHQLPMQPAEIPVQPPGSPFLPGKPPQGMLQQQRTWPVRPPQLLRHARRPRLRLPVTGASDRIRVRKPSSSSTGVIAAVVLMIAFIIVAIQMLASLFSSIAGVFP
jgi:hypothetical protein